MVCSAANTPFTSFVLSCVDSANILVSSPGVIARAPGFIAFMDTVVILTSWSSWLFYAISSSSLGSGSS